MSHNLWEKFGPIPEALQEKDECINCKTSQAAPGSLVCNPCREKL